MIIVRFEGVVGSLLVSGICIRKVLKLVGSEICDF